MLTVQELEARLKADSLSRIAAAERLAAGETDVSVLDTLPVRVEEERVERPAEKPIDVRPAPERADSVAVSGRWITRPGHSRPVTVSFVGNPLPDVLTLFSTFSGLSIVASDEEQVLSKAITGDLENQPWHVAFETLLRAHGLRAVQDTLTGIITVATEGRVAATRDPEMIRLQYVDANDLLETIRTIIGAGESESSDAVNIVNTGSARSNTLLIYTSPEKMQKVHALVAQVDRKRPTVAISAKLVSVNRSNLERMGFTYGITNAADKSAENSSQAGTGQSVGQPGVMVQPLNPFQRGNQGGGFPGGMGQGQQQGPQATLSLLQTLSLSPAVSLNVFFDVLTSVGLAEVEVAPTIVTESDLAAEINVGEFFILPNSPPVLTASGGQGQFVQPGMQGMGQYPGQGGMGQFPGQYGGMGQFPGQYGGMGQGQYQGQFPGGQGGIIGAGGGGWGSFETGTTLKVTPYVLSNGRIRMDLDISRDGGTLAPNGQTITGGTQSVRTLVTVRDGEVIVIGGLTVVERTTSTTGVPVLSDLPLIGRFFKTTEAAALRQDLVIVVTPHVIYDEDDDVESRR